MAAELIEVADAIVTELNAADLSQEFTAVRSYDAETELEDDGTLHVDVVPVRAVPASETRGSVGYECEIDIGVRYRFAAADHSGGKVKNASVDPFLLFYEELVELLWQMRLTAFENAVSRGVEPRLVWSPAHLAELSQYTGIVRSRFYVSKDL